MHEPLFEEAPMHSHHLCQHSPCHSRVQPTQSLTRWPRFSEPLLLVSPSVISRRLCSRHIARRATIYCSVIPNRPQSESDQSPTGGTLPARPPSNSPLLAVGSIGLAVIAFVASRSLLGRPALDELKLHSMPLDSALSNGRPTVLEFYADWCEVCNELAPTTLQIEQTYKDSVNFVLLNIENTKWAPEVAEYGVRGIPHFVFLDKDGAAQAAVVGRLPQEVLEGDVKALAQSTALPFRGIKRQTSAMTKPPSLGQPQTSPRDHA